MLSVNERESGGGQVLLSVVSLCCRSLYRASLWLSSLAGVKRGYVGLLQVGSSHVFVQTSLVGCHSISSAALLKRGMHLICLALFQHGLLAIDCL